MKRLLPLVLCGCLFSCSNINEPSAKFNQIQSIKLTPTKTFVGKKKKMLTDYVTQSTNELVSNLTYLTPKSVIAITNFVFTDSDFNSSPIFAAQLKESYIYEFYKLGQPTIELRASGLIKVTDNGEFFLTKDYRLLRSKLPVDYVLVGTISRLKSGVILNARIVGVESQAVVAASQTFIPQSAIIDFITSPHKTSKIKLVKG